MKLRNRKTGEIIEFDAILPVKDVSGDSVAHLEYGSLAELNEEWEDATEEPKEYWFMDYGGRIKVINDANDEEDVARKEIGNYFETEEEAKKAVEKLKCFTNLKNHEFMFDGWYYSTDGNIVIFANAHEFNDMEEQDLTKVFGEKIC